MDIYLMAAAVLSFFVGLVHSVLGERLIFQRLRKGTWIPAHGAELLHGAHVRIVWATWHLVTILGWGMSAMLVYLAQPAQIQAGQMLLHIIMMAMFVGSGLVCVATRGRHPGWLGLLGVAILVALAGA